MKLTRYWVFHDDGKGAIELATFDDTELGPATDWNQAWQNQGPAAPSRAWTTCVGSVWS